MLLAVCARLSDAPLWRPERLIQFHENAQVGEAQAWWKGRLDLPERIYDTALVDGRGYSYFPPMFTFIAAVFVPFFNGVPHLVLVILAGTMVLLAYFLMYARTRSATWSFVLAGAFILGTSVWPVIDRALRTAAPYHVNHLLSTIGLLLFLIDYFGARRVWPGLIGVAMTVCSRQMTIAFALPLAYLAIEARAGESSVRRVATFLVGIVVISGVHLTLNTLKFGHPLTTGYMLNHEGREDVFAREAREFGILSAHWIPRNLYYTNIGLPEVQTVEVAGERRTFVRPNNMGTGIWWTSPILLLLFAALPSVWKDRRQIWLLAAACLVFGLLMLWHATGAMQRGYNRYSLDYIPAFFALLAPIATTGRRRWFTLALSACGIVYFVVLLPMPHWEL